MGRYDRNIGTITQSEQELLAGKSVCVIGCGGLGGGVIEGLVRLGVGKITIIDGDVFDETNLNRQVLSNPANIGKSKAEEGAKQMSDINPNINIQPVFTFYNEQNGRDLISGHDLVVDALDNVSARLCLEDHCDAENIPLVHGAICSWYGQVAVVMPGDRLLHKIYLEDSNEATSNPSFTPAVVSAMQVAESVKVLLGKEGVLQNKLLTIDLLSHEYEIIDFGE